ILGAQASKRSRRQELLAGVFYSWDTGPWFGGFGMPARLARPKRGALLYGRAEHARRYSARRWYSFGPLFEQSLDRGRGQASLLARLHRVFFNQSTERRSVGRHSLTPHNHFEQRVGDGFVVGQRQQVGREIKCDSYSRAGFDLPHQHDQRISGRGLCRLFVDFAGKRHTRAVRALRVPFEPSAIVTRPRTPVRHAVGVSGVAGAGAIRKSGMPSLSRANLTNVRASALVKNSCIVSATPTSACLRWETYQWQRRPS